MGIIGEVFEKEGIMFFLDEFWKGLFNLVFLIVFVIYDLNMCR